MKYGIYRRVIEVELLLLTVASLFLLAYLLLTYMNSSIYFLMFKTLFILACIAFLTSSRLFSFLQSKFPALKRYVIRLILVACLLAMFPSWDLTPSSGIVYYTSAGSIFVSIILIGIAKIGTILGQ